MRSFEVTFIVDPVLSGDEIKSTAQTYVDLLKSEGAEIVHMDEIGLRQLAYPIKKRHSGVYFCIEFQIEKGTVIDLLTLALRRDERIMRFLPARLDKFGVKFNADRRAGLIGKSRKKKTEEPAPAQQASTPPAASAKEAVATAAAPVAVAASSEEE